MRTAEAIKSNSTNINNSPRLFFKKKESGDFFTGKNSAKSSGTFFSGTLQPKLNIGKVNDKYEQEADQVADNVVNRIQKYPENTFENTSTIELISTNSNIQQKCESCEKEEGIQKGDEKSEDDNNVLLKPIFENDSELHEDKNIHRKELNTNSSQLIEAQLNASKGKGNHLGSSVQRQMESSMNADFSNVRLHTGADAIQLNEQLNAKAFTHGNDIYFNQGNYSPGTSGGKRLLAHELTHTIQQKRQSGNNIQRIPGSCQRGRRGASHIVLVRATRRMVINGDITSEERRAIVSYSRRRSTTSQERCRILTHLERRAARGRSTRGLRHISNFNISPRTIRVDQGESARISFNVAGTDLRSISCMILKYEFSSERPDHRSFHFANATAGHKVAIWDGTFRGSRNRPPEPGTYRVRIYVTTNSGHTEQVFDQIRVLNPTSTTVLPRTYSGLRLESMLFTRGQVILTDERHNAIVAVANSGLSTTNRRNRSRINYMNNQRHQCVPNRGPLPEGDYYIAPNSVQTPALSRGSLRYPTGSGASAWGPFRVPLVPATGTNVCGRSEFFFHLDVTDDGTAGCIGVASRDEGKFNQMIALLMRLQGRNLPVRVRY